MSSRKWKGVFSLGAITLVPLLTSSSLIDDYKHHASRLRVTGGGLGGNDNTSVPLSNNPVEFMDFYIPATGPEEKTPFFAKNLWGKL